MIHFDEKNVTHFVAQDITSKEQLISYGINNSEELKIPSSINKYDVITVDSKLLNEQLKSGKGITISLGGKDYPAEISRMNFENIDDGIDSYHGTLPGIKNSDILFTTGEKVLIGRITLDDGIYWIIPVESGEKMEISEAPLHIIYNSRDVTSSKFRIDNGIVGKYPDIPPVNPEDNLPVKSQKTSLNLLQTPLSQTVTVNILVVTDSIYWNNDAWHSEAESIIAEANLKLSVSDINVHLNPIYDDSRRGQLSSSPDKTIDPLAAFTNVYPPDLLDSYGADIGLYLGGYDLTYGEYSGAQGLSLGFNLNNPIYCRYSWAQMVPDNLGYWATLHGKQVISIHEIGHQFDAGHDDATYSPSYARASTYGLPPQDKKSVLWHDFSETASLTDFSSNEDWTWAILYFPPGLAYIPLGDNNHDNARRISETRDIVSKYAEGILNGKSMIGIFRDGNWKLDNNNDGIPDQIYTFGTTGDIPVIIDWNGDGISETACFRPSNGNWYVAGYPIIHFGKSGDIPVVGDWNGDGTYDIGVFRPSVGDWYLDINRDGTVDYGFHFGKSGDIPVVGDWNADWHCDIGVFRPSIGTWYLDTTKTGVVFRAFQFGRSGDIPVVGDWNGEGSSDAGVFRPSAHSWYLNFNKNTIVDKAIQFGTTGDIPIVGNWDNVDISATSDIGVFRPSTGYWYRDYSDNGIVYASSPYQMGTIGDTPIVGKWI